MKKILLPILSISLIIALIFIIVGYSNQKTDSVSLPKIYSHRGASGEEVEHTFAAYDLAVKYGSEYIEQDVVTSKDKILFVSHDLSAQKITGIDKLYSDMTSAEIDKLRTNDGQKILRLQSIFDRYKKDVTYVIELKGDIEQTNLFSELISSNNIADNIIVQSFDAKALDVINKEFPDMEKLLLVNDQAALTKAVTLKNIDIISINKSLLTKKNIKLVKDNNKQINAWTLNSTDEILQAISLGVDSYFTDYTAKAILLQGKYSK